MKTWMKWLVVPILGVVLWGFTWATPTLAASSIEETATGRKGGGGYCGRYLQDKREAEALGVTVERLRESRREAALQALQEALESGKITQEQYEARRAWMTLREEYLNPEQLLSEVLEMSVDDLRAACEEGKTVRDLIQEKGMDGRTFRQAMEDAVVKQVLKALDDDVISTETLVRAWVHRMGRGMTHQGQPGGGEMPLGPGAQGPTP